MIRPTFREMIQIFFTGYCVHLRQEPRFGEEGGYLGTDWGKVKEEALFPGISSVGLDWRRRWVCCSGMFRVMSEHCFKKSIEKWGEGRFLQYRVSLIVCTFCYETASPPVLSSPHGWEGLPQKRRCDLVFVVLNWGQWIKTTGDRGWS